jgi:hypothetical protein
MTDVNGKVVPEERSNYPLWAFRNVMALLGVTTIVNVTVVNSFADLIAAFLAAFVYAVVLHPLDTYKTRLQAGLPGLNLHGVIGLYSGLLYGILKEGLTKVLWMSAFLAFSMAPFNMVNMYGVLLAGTMAITISSFLRVPFEMVCKRRQVGSLQTAGLFTIRETLRSNSWQLSVCWMVTAFRELQTFFLAVFIFAGFEKWVPLFVNSPLPIVVQLLGWVSIFGGLATLPSTAADVIATDLMTETADEVDAPMTSPAPDHAGQKVYGLLGMAERILISAATLWNEGGFGRLFRAWVPRFAYSVAAGFIFMSGLMMLTAVPQSMQIV